MDIRINNATKYIKNALILDNVSLELHGGTIYGLQGPNGSGKTMLMRLISGLIRPTKGTVEIDGKRLGKDMDFPASMGLLIEEPAFLPNHTGLKNLELLAEIQSKVSNETIRQTLRDVGLAPDDKRSYTVIYLNEEGQEIYYVQSLITDGEDHIDTEDASAQVIEIENCKAFVVVKNGTTQILWINGPYKFQIISNTDYETVIAIAEKIIINNL